MTKPLTQIKLPTDRVNQLRSFAQGMGDATLSGALGAVFKVAREQGLIAHGIPSVQINAVRDGIAIQFDQGELVGFTFDEAQSLAVAIQDCLSGKNEGRKIVANGLAIGGSFSVQGRGNAIAVAVPKSAAPKMFTRDLALELADLLELECMLDDLELGENVVTDGDVGEPMTSSELEALDAAICAKEAENRLADSLAAIAKIYHTNKAKKKAQGRKRIAKHRANLTPAKEAEERAKARERMRLKRAADKAANTSSTSE